MTNIGIITIITFILNLVAPSVAQDVKLSPSPAIGVDEKPFFWGCELVNTNLVPSQIRWLYNNQYIVSEGRKQVMTNGTLAWSSVRKEDEGAYQCEVRVNSVVYKSEVAAFRLAYLATSFSSSPLSQTKGVGEMVTMGCQIYSSPPAVITWHFNGIPLSSNLFAKVSDLRSELTLVSLSYNRAGKYTCQAVNSLTGTSLSTQPATLTIQGIPTWVSPPEDQRTEVGNFVILNCLARSIPAPIIAWTRVDKETAITGQEVGYTIYQNGSLRIDNLALTHQGRYRCEVENGFGKISQTAILLVAPVAPKLRFVSTPNNTDVIEGRSVSFQCIAYPNAVVTWSKVGSALAVGRMEQTQDGTLRILNVMTSDTGTYTCTAVYGSETISHSMQLQVRVGPWFSTFPNDVVLPLGNDLKLDCSVRGDPTPSVYWILPSGVSVTPTTSASPRVRVLGTQLQVATVTSNDSGKYTCVAENMVAKASVTVTINVACLYHSKSQFSL